MEAPAPATVLSRSQHAVSRSQFSAGARKVLRRLNQAGREACLVGGSVRDLMLNREPKDYDIVTDARPEEVRRIFRNSRIIGRRFRLVHVLFGDEVVEVSTFRGAPDPEHQRRSPGELLVTSDNTYGTPWQDAFRRDFTINALLYRTSDRAVVDYVGGAGTVPAGFSQLAERLDERVNTGPEVPLAVLLSTLLLPRIVAGRERLEAGGAGVQRRRLQRLVDDVVAEPGR